MAYKPKSYKKFVATASTSTLNPLVQIKKNWEFRKDVRGHIEGVDVDWLIEQAEKVERYEKAIKVAMQNTHDDDTHEFLNRLLQGKENDAPQYRLKTE